MSRVFYGHDPYEGTEGTDVLLTVWDDGTYEVALRPGRQWRGITWGPPVQMADVTEEGQ